METEPAKSVSVTPTTVTAVSPTKRKSHMLRYLMLLILLLLLCCLAAMTGLLYFALRGSTFNLGGTCYNGFDNFMAGRTVACPVMSDTNGAPGANGNNGAPGTPGANPSPNPNPNPSPNPVPPTGSNGGLKVFVNDNLKFMYPDGSQTSTANNGDVTVVTPDGQSLVIGAANTDGGAINATKCNSIANSTLNVLQGKDSLASLLGSATIGSVGDYPACVFNVNTSNGHIEYRYFIKDGNGYLVTLDSGNSTQPTQQLLDTANSLQIL